MYLGTANRIVVSGFDRQGVVDKAKEIYNNEGYQIWNSLDKELHLYRWIRYGKEQKWEYKIELYKPDFEIIRKNE